MVQPLSPLSTSFHCSLIGSLTLLGIRVMNLLSFFSCSCRHIRYSLCYLKTPFGEWGEYIYITEKRGGCPPSRYKEGGYAATLSPRSPCCALVPRSHGLPVQRVRPNALGTHRAQQQSLVPRHNPEGCRFAPFSTACECVSRM